MQSGEHVPAGSCARFRWYDEFVDIFLARIAAAKIGDPAGPPPSVSDLRISQAALDRILCGDRRRRQPRIGDCSPAAAAWVANWRRAIARADGGFPVAPTTRRTWRRPRRFGPAVLGHPVHRTTTSAVSIASDSRYGLDASPAHPRSGPALRSVARRLEVGSVLGQIQISQIFPQGRRTGGLWGRRGFWRTGGPRGLATSSSRSKNIRIGMWAEAGIRRPLRRSIRSGWIRPGSDCHSVLIDPDPVLRRQQQSERTVHGWKS